MAIGPETEHDAVVVGSGAGGGMAAYVLTRAGLKVLMVEAGRDYDPASETPMFNRSVDAPLGGAGTPEKSFGGYYHASIGGFELEGEPYTVASGSKFQWYRSRMLGGRTNHWGRNSFRMGPYDFKAKSRDGLGVDWPIEYEDIEPYYDRVEKLIGVYGVNSGLENHPDSPPGILHEPPAPRVFELLIKAAANDLGQPCVPARRAILTRKIDEREPCFYATSCARGCNIGAGFQTTTSLLPWARATGKLDILTDAMVHEIEVGPTGRATGLWYIDKRDGKHKFIKARTIVLAASTGETARILLNSKNSLHPDGVANGNGQLGRYLQDTVGAGMVAQIPSLENRPRYNEDGASGLHMYMPFGLYEEQRMGKLNFPRGYHIEIAGGFGTPSVGLSGMTDFIKGYGKDFKDEARRYYGSFIAFLLRGEKIPNENCFVEIDSEVKDKFGIPVLKFHYEHSHHEINQVAHFQKTVRSIVNKLRGNLVVRGNFIPATIPAIRPARFAIDDGGQVIHEVGTCRMGDDPQTSVVNAYGQAWDVDNLFIADGSIFSTKAHKNPTLTILALAWRNADHLVQKMKEGVL